MTKEEKTGIKSVPQGWRIFDGTPLVSAQASEKGSMPYEFEGKTYYPPTNRHWTLTKEGLDGLVRQKRIFAIGNRLEYRK